MRIQSFRGKDGHSFIHLYRIKESTPGSSSTFYSADTFESSGVSKALEAALQGIGLHRPSFIQAAAFKVALPLLGIVATFVTPSSSGYCAKPMMLLRTYLPCRPLQSTQGICLWLTILAVARHCHTLCQSCSSYVIMKTAMAQELPSRIVQLP